MFAASVLTGVEAFGYSIIEVCKGPTKTISDFEQHYESYRKRAELGKMRNNSLMNWLQRHRQRMLVKFGESLSFMKAAKPGSFNWNRTQESIQISSNAMEKSASIMIR